MHEDFVVSCAPKLESLLSRSDSSASSSDLQDRARGVMLGLAAGNLLGLPVEGDGHHHIATRFPGGLTEIHPAEANREMDDDLAQSVDLGEALLAGGDFDADFIERLIVWRRVNGRGIGITTAAVIDELERERRPPIAARTIYESRNRIAPNGGVMRCAPVAIARRSDPTRLVSDSASTCAVTHYAATCQWSCIIVNAVIAQFLNRVEPDMSALLNAAQDDGCPDLLAIAQRDRIPAAPLEAIASCQAPPVDNAWLLRDHGMIGHTLLAMQFGLWAAATPMTFEDALIASVGAGGDTDTNAAVAGAVLGARHGASAIPQRWLDCIPQRQRIENLADRLAALASG